MMIVQKKNFKENVIWPFKWQDTAVTAWNVTSTTHLKSTAFTLNCPILFIQKKSQWIYILNTSYFCLVLHYTLNRHNRFFFVFFYPGLWPKPTVSICIWHKTFDGPLLKVNKLLGRLQVGGLNMFLFFQSKSV